MERSNGGKLVGAYGTREEAEKAKAALIAEDFLYEDVLYVVRKGGDAPSDEDATVPPSLGHGTTTERSRDLRGVVQRTRRRPN